MIAFTLALLFLAASIIAAASLVDSAVRGCNAWRSIQREMAAEQSGERVTFTGDVVAFRNIKPVRAGVQPLFAQAANQSGAIPTAAAA
ncbi:MAG: hypothetical protein ABJP34_11250 [Erythrobacter sp.]